MEFATGALGTLLPKLGQLLLDEYNLQKGTKKNIEFLSRELESMRAALCSVGEVPPEQLKEQVRIWARDIRELSYDMEDIVDTFLVRVHGPEPPSKRSAKRFIRKMVGIVTKATTRHEIAQEINDIMERVKEVAERRERYKIDAITPPKTMIDPRIASLYTEAANLVGVDEPREELVTRLTKGAALPAQKKIVSIVGFGGLGKTTLAKAVYDKLKGQFDCTAFVPVGRNPDLKKVFKDILIDLDKEINFNLDILDERQLIDKLREFLEKKRYFIVIDDVWQAETWETIKLALVENNIGSRIIITTRKYEVAREAGEVYKLQRLSDDNSRKLFFARIFGAESKSCHHQPDDVSDKILGKCGGIPLAIITMASMLVGKSTEDWYVVCNTPGFYRGNEGRQVHDTEWILSLSYYDLPLNLRTCLLYLSVYPEDCLIEKDPLIWKWIAEGFVEMKTGTTLFERGEEYFNQLINSSLIQGESSQRTGIIHSCRVHDMVLDLIRDLSRKVNFVTISNDDDEGISQRNKQVRRLAHHNRSMKPTQEDDDMGMAKVRSLVVRGCKIDSSFLHPSFELLRVLALEGCGFVKGWQGLRHLGNLVHLRYLGLQNTFIYELSEEIGKLKFLQTLDLENSGIGLLPSGICQLTQLLCLRGGYYMRAPDGFLKKVTSLEELCININNLDDESKRQFIKDLGNLSQVRVLTINGELTGGMALQSELVRSLGNLHKLQRLRLALWYLDGWVEWEDTVVLPRALRELDLGAVPFRRLPSCISPAHLQNLYQLCLRVDALDEAGLRALGGLPELYALELLMVSKAAPVVASINIAGDGFFQKLRRCLLRGWMIHLVLNKEDEDSMASVLVTFWNGNGVVPFGSRTKQHEDDDDCSSTSVLQVVPPPAMIMPNLQELEFEVPVRALYKDGNGGCHNLGLQFLSSLARVDVWVDCGGATADDVEKAAAELRNAAQLHPNKLIFDIQQVNNNQMMAL